METKVFKARCRKNTATLGFLPEHEFNLVRAKENYTIQRSETPGMNTVTGPFYNKAGRYLVHSLDFPIRFCADHLRIVK